MGKENRLQHLIDKLSEPIFAITLQPINKSKIKFYQFLLSLQRQLYAIKGNAF